MNDGPVTHLAVWLVLITEGGLTYLDSIDIVEQGLSCISYMVILFVKVYHRNIPKVSLVIMMVSVLLFLLSLCFFMPIVFFFLNLRIFIIRIVFWRILGRFIMMIIAIAALTCSNGGNRLRDWFGFF